ncbi:hypothetical protein TNCV_2630281 [Trichonephila clavipes]|uniref:Uncharacterized protein n=1 Tax=Trichonephila clavipes TaxID=2585209 RepID=A0A8X6SDR3_TRICX|nr:hypothetical protein TNCV_2630281 [Trichonephila clavipes]
MPSVPKRKSAPELQGKTYEEVCQLYQRQSRKQPPIRANTCEPIGRTESVADEKRPEQPSISEDTWILALVGGCFPTDS